MIATPSNDERRFTPKLRIVDGSPAIEKPPPVNLARASEIWEAALKNIQNQIPTPAFRTWFQATIALDYTPPRTLILQTPDEFIAKQLDSNYYHILVRAIESATGELLDIEFKPLVVMIDDPNSRERAMREQRAIDSDCPPSEHYHSKHQTPDELACHIENVFQHSRAVQFVAEAGFDLLVGVLDHLTKLYGWDMVHSSVKSPVGLLIYHTDLAIKREKKSVGGRAHLKIVGT